MREIYLDNSATTCVDEELAEIAARVMTQEYGNPSSLHKKGLAAQLVLEAAREQVANALACQKEEIIFTATGTEANNLALFGAAAARKRAGKTVIATAWEHSSVLELLRELEKQGYTIRLIKPDMHGHMDIGALAGAVNDDTVLLSCMLVNSEVGSIADVAELVKLARRRNPNILVHCDAVQALGKLAFSAKKLDVDLLSVSGHKIYAPKGAGALYCKKGVRILPLLYGGGQEKALRPGTQSVPLIAAFGKACQNAAENLPQNLAHAQKLQQRFIKTAEKFPLLCRNSPPDATPYICNIALPGYRSEIVLHYLAAKGIFVSSGSACAGGKPSHVLTAMGLAPKIIDSALRVSFSKRNTTRDIDDFFAGITQAMKEIKA